MIERVMPHDRDAEMGVIGSMMSGGPTVVDEMQALLTADSFYVPAHQIVFGGILGLHASGVPTDLITLTSATRDAEMLEMVGGEIALTQMFTAVPSPANAGYYAAIVREKELLRRMITVCGETTVKCYGAQGEAKQTLDELQSNVIELAQIAGAGETIRHVREFSAEAVKQIEATYYGRGKVTGLATGFSDYDRMTNGLEKGYVYVFGARPAMGKTSLGLSFAEHIAVENAAAGNKVLFFSLEMTGVQLARRMVLSAANVSLQRMRDGFLKKEDLPRVHAAAERLVKSQVFLDDKPGLNLFEFRARARRAVIKFGVKVIIVDYLQMMHGVSRRARENRQAEISEVIQAIAETAKELQVPVVVLAQLSRRPEERKWGIPEMPDLRESGDIENYAHLIALLWRPEYYAHTEKQMAALAEFLSSDARTFTADDLNGYAQAIIVKQREGPTGPAPLRFVKEFARFENESDRPLYSNNPEERQK